jgi:predicted ribosome quality control (RQC) complex YloA/Tae2 family protein
MKTVTRYIDCIKESVDFTVGGNAQENHDIIDAADPEDLWFHLSGQASCHVICKVPDGLDKKTMLKIAKQGAVICKENSCYKSAKNVEVDYTQVKNVTKLEKPGAVTIMNAKKMVI